MQKNTFADKATKNQRKGVFSHVLRWAGGPALFIIAANGVPDLSSIIQDEMNY